MQIRWMTMMTIVAGLAAGPLLAQPDSATRPASYRYEEPSFFRRLLFGSNYRAVWSTAVTAPVLHLSQKGLTVTELGGGQQTKSLRLADRQGREWVLRTIDKDASGLKVPKGIPRGLAKSVAQDMFSASFPYAPLVVYGLTRAAGITAPRPFLYYVANDPALGAYDSIFAGQLCFLEQREPTPDGSDTKNTFDLIELLEKDQHNRVLQQQVLTARLIDMLVGDWDRHEDQWRWGQRDSAGLHWYYSIPRDRDQAFFQSGGWLVKLGRLFGAKHFVGFGPKKIKARQLNHKTWAFDKRFLNSLDEADWRQAIEDLQRRLTDSVVDAAVRQLPLSVFLQEGPQLAESLKSRRALLTTEAMEYYRYLSEEVWITGSDQAEVFELGNEGKGLWVAMCNEKGRLLYRRQFSPEVTYRLVLNGLGGNDQFQLAPAAGALHSRIRVVLHGDAGDDSYPNNSSRRLKIGRR